MENDKIISLSIPSPNSKYEMWRRIISIYAGSMLSLDFLDPVSVCKLMKWNLFPVGSCVTISFIRTSHGIDIQAVNIKNLVKHLQNCLRDIEYDGDIDIIENYSEEQILLTYILLIQDRLLEIEKILQTITVILLTGEIYTKYMNLVKRVSNETKEKGHKVFNFVTKNTHPDDLKSDLFYYLMNTNYKLVDDGNGYYENDCWCVNSSFVLEVLKGLSICRQPHKICGLNLNCGAKNCNRTTEDQIKYYNCITAFMTSSGNINMINKTLSNDDFYEKIDHEIVNITQNKKLIDFTKKVLIGLIHTNSNVFILARNYIECIWKFFLKPEEIKIIGNFIEEFFNRELFDGINNEVKNWCIPYKRLALTISPVNSMIKNKLFNLFNTDDFDDKFFDGFLCFHPKMSKFHFTWTIEEGIMWYHDGYSWKTLTFDDFFNLEKFTLQ